MSSDELVDVELRVIVRAPMTQQESLSKRPVMRSAVAHLKVDALTSRGLRAGQEGLPEMVLAARGFAKVAEDALIAVGRTSIEQTVTVDGRCDVIRADEALGDRYIEDITEAKPEDNDILLTDELVDAIRKEAERHLTSDHERQGRAYWNPVTVDRICMWLGHLDKSVKLLDTDIPVQVNTPGGWVRYKGKLNDTGIVEAGEAVEAEVSPIIDLRTTNDLANLRSEVFDRIYNAVVTCRNRDETHIPTINKATSEVFELLDKSLDTNHPFERRSAPSSEVPPASRVSPLRRLHNFEEMDGRSHLQGLWGEAERDGESHGRPGPKPAEQLVDVVGRCPSCGGRTLFIGNGGHITCSWVECKDPVLVDKWLDMPAVPVDRNDAMGWKAYDERIDNDADIDGLREIVKSEARLRAQVSRKLAQLLGKENIALPNHEQTRSEGKQPEQGSIDPGDPPPSARQEQIVYEEHPLGKIPYLPAHNHAQDQACNVVTCPLGSWQHYQEATGNHEETSGDPWKEVDKLREELRSAKMKEAGFADFAEAFCTGWNRRREVEDMAYSDNPDVFTRQLMEAYRNSGSQRAKRFTEEARREKIEMRSPLTEWAERFFGS